MKSDIYTKIILTIIAICLTFNVLKDLDIVTVAKADVKNVNTTIIDVNIKEVNGRPFYGNKLPVTTEHN